MSEGRDQGEERAQSQTLRARPPPPIEKLEARGGQWTVASYLDGAEALGPGGLWAAPSVSPVDS